MTSQIKLAGYNDALASLGLYKSAFGSNTNAIHDRMRQQGYMGSRGGTYSATVRGGVGNPNAVYSNERGQARGEPDTEVASRSPRQVPQNHFARMRGRAQKTRANAQRVVARMNTPRAAEGPSSFERSLNSARPGQIDRNPTGPDADLLNPGKPSGASRAPLAGPSRGAMAAIRPNPMGKGTMAPRGGVKPSPVAKPTPVAAPAKVTPVAKPSLPSPVPGVAKKAPGAVAKANPLPASNPFKSPAAPGKKPVNWNAPNMQNAANKPSAGLLKKWNNQYAAKQQRLKGAPAANPAAAAAGKPPTPAIASKPTNWNSAANKGKPGAPSAALKAKWNAQYAAKQKRKNTPGAAPKPAPAAMAAKSSPANKASMMGMQLPKGPAPATPTTPKRNAPPTPTAMMGVQMPKRPGV